MSIMTNCLSSQTYHQKKKKNCNVTAINVSKHYVLPNSNNSAIIVFKLRCIT